MTMTQRRILTDLAENEVQRHGIASTMVGQCQSYSYDAVDVFWLIGASQCWRRSAIASNHGRMAVGSVQTCSSLR
jgi:hypothetical protein